MKNIFAIICIIGALSTGLTGCKKTLQENPVTQISPTAFFSNPASYEQAVIGIYSSVSAVLQNSTMSEMFSDICGSPNPKTEQALPTYQNNHQPFFYNVRGEWQNDYAMINNANFILGYLPAAPLTDVNKNALIGEAEFLRAFAYFRLVQFYGGVPLRTTTITNYTNVQFPRASEDSVYDLILSDLTFAEANLPDDAPQQGRVYKLAATALLAKVYLTMAGNPLNHTAYFQNARDEALAVINSGKFKLDASYPQIFHNLAYTTESIWEQLFVSGKGGNGFESACSTAAGFTPVLVPLPWFTNSFPAGDQRNTWGIDQTYVDPTGNTLTPFFQKFVDNTTIDQSLTPSSIICSFTIPILRLGEMYLVAAEAENEVNGPANAYQYINTIRARARVDKNNPADVPDLAGLTQDQFRSAVIMERKWELHLEGSTWFDLKRTNTLSNIQAVRGSSLAIPIGAYNNTWYIPDVETNVNNIPQNPLY